MWLFKSHKNTAPLSQTLPTLGENINDLFFILECLVDGILVFDSKGNLHFMNQAAEKIFAVSRKKVLGKYILTLTPFARFSPLVAILGGEPSKVFRQPMTLEPNLIIEITSIPIQPDGVRIGTIVTLYDVSREKSVEKSKSDFVTLAAHGLRTPTAGIKWSLKMLLDEDVGKITPQQREILEKTYLSNDKVISLINDLLNVARIEEGKFLTHVALSNFASIIEGAMKTYEDVARMNNIRVEFKKSPNVLPSVMVDAQKMQLAVENLLDNAVRYTRSGGKVTVALREANGQIEFQISDNGLGIPQQQQQSVFRKFFRAENVMKVETEGTGLGLFIAKSIVEAHQGKIWFESQEGKGATFFISIPLRKKYGEFLGEDFY